MDGPLPYVVRRGAGAPMLFIHGNGVDHRLLLELDDCFADPGDWERIYLDLPGFGKTPALGAEDGLPEIADWLDDVVGKAVGATSFALVANSLGGLLARELAARRPQQVMGLALLAPVVDPVAANRRRPERQVLRQDPDLLDLLDDQDAADYEEMAVMQSPENWPRFRRAALPGIRAADANAMERLAQRYTLPSAPEDRMLRFTRPTVIITGRQDHIVGYEDQDALLSRYPRASCLVLDEAGHNVHLDQPHLVRAALRAWSASLVDRR